MARSARLVGPLLVLLVSRPALAAPDEENFSSYHDRALQLYQAHRYEEAIVALEAAQALRPDPRLHLNLGHAYRRLGRGEQALFHYQRYREEVPNLSASDLAAVEEYITLARRAQEAVKEPPPPAPAAPPTVAPLVVVSPRVVSPPTISRRPPPPPLPLHRRWWFWGILGVATAGAVTAAILSTQPWDANLPPGAPIHDPKFF